MKKEHLLTASFFSVFMTGCVSNPPQQPAPIVIQTPPQTQTIYTPAPTAAQFYNECVVAYNNQEYGFAASKCNEAISSSPNYIEAHIKLGEAYEKMGDNNSAVSAYLNAARLLAKQGKCEEPRALYYRILSIFPNHVDATRGLNSLSCKTSTTTNKTPHKEKQTQPPPSGGGKSLPGGGAWREW